MIIQEGGGGGEDVVVKKPQKLTYQCTIVDAVPYQTQEVQPLSHMMELKGLLQNNNKLCTNESSSE